MRTIVVGDIHGKIDVVNQVFSKNLPVIFVGDYVDSYEGNVEDQLYCIRRIISECRNYKAQALKGNHELSYLIGGNMKCSGFNIAMEAHMMSLDGTEYLQDYIWCDDYLITHAGVSLTNLKANNYSSKQIQSYLDEGWTNGHFYDIGISRGGRSVSGGIFWCDYRWDFVPVPGIKQIFGHTRCRDIQEQEDNWCIDVLDTQNNRVLVIEDGKAYPTTLDEV